MSSSIDETKLHKLGGNEINPLDSSTGTRPLPMSAITRRNLQQMYRSAMQLSYLLSAEVSSHRAIDSMTYGIVVKDLMSIIIN